MAETAAIAGKEKLYEGMFLVESGKFATDPDGVASHILGLLEKIGAEIVTHRPWQDGKLAYEIEGHRKGLHYLVCFKYAGPNLSELDRGVKLSDLVLRHLVISQPPQIFEALVAAITSDEEPAEVPATVAAAVVEETETDDDED
ncbi:MAG: 30S ribosomal protein S6 [Planctomycetaceae bacterium]